MGWIELKVQISQLPVERRLTFLDAATCWPVITASVYNGNLLKAQDQQPTINLKTFINYLNELTTLTRDAFSLQLYIIFMPKNLNCETISLTARPVCWQIQRIQQNTKHTFKVYLSKEYLLCPNTLPSVYSFWKTEKNITCSKLMSAVTHFGNITEIV